MSATVIDICEIERFCDRWIEKADRYQSDCLEDLFDKYFTLFVAYNRIYSVAAELHLSTLDAKKAIFLRGDRRSATSIMAILITQPRFEAKLIERPYISVACETISSLIKNQRFFLHTIRGSHEPDRMRDGKMVKGLSRCNLEAVLDCLYQIRCNIFHGEKEFVPDQAELLMSSITLLKEVVFLSRIALREAVIKAS